MKVHVSVIEYDNGHDPERFVATEDDIARAWTVKDLIAHAEWWDDQKFIESHPAPDYSHAGQVGHWLNEVREAFTSPSISVEEVLILESLPEG